MTKKERLVTVREGATDDEVLQLLHKHRIEKVLVVNDDFELRGLITVKDIQKSTDFPHAAKDSSERLLRRRRGRRRRRHRDARRSAGGSRRRRDRRRHRARPLAGRARHASRWVKKNFPKLQVIGGNIVTGDAALALVDAGADAVKVGIGPGSICTTRIVAGVGVPQITAVVDGRRGAAGPHPADRRRRHPLLRRHRQGASSPARRRVMIGGLFAGTEESPGEVELYQGAATRAIAAWARSARWRAPRLGRPLLPGRRRGARQARARRHRRPRAVQGPRWSAIVHQLAGGLRAAMGYTGCATIEEMRTKPKFVRVTGAGMRESHVHDVQITKEAPNYRVS